MQLRLGEGIHSVFYAPLYVALHKGLFAHEGLEVSFTAFGEGRRLYAAMERGEVDVCVGGIMRSLVAFDQGAASVAVHFANVNDRDGFFLLGRKTDSEQQFTWADLLGRRLILFSEAPTPWYVLRAVLREQGLDPDQIEVIQNLPADEAARRFREGAADFLEAPANIAEALLRDGAVLLREMARVAGPIPYSSYCTRLQVLNEQTELIAAVVRAHMAALRWMRTASGAEIWEVIEPSFPGGEPEIMPRAVEHLRLLGTWTSDATLPRHAFDRLAELLRRGGLITRIAPYELVCDDRVVRALNAGG